MSKIPSKAEAKRRGAMISDAIARLKSFANSNVTNDDIKVLVRPLRKAKVVKCLFCRRETLTFIVGAPKKYCTAKCRSTAAIIRRGRVLEAERLEADQKETELRQLARDLDKRKGKAVEEK